jgi:hypothetical protein
MDSYYLEEVLKSLSEKQQLMSDTLSEALLKSENEDEKKEIQKLLDYNEKIKEAINNKDLNSLQKIYSDASTNI